MSLMIDNNKYHLDLTVFVQDIKCQLSVSAVLINDRQIVSCQTLEIILLDALNLNFSSKFVLLCDFRCISFFQDASVELDSDFVHRQLLIEASWIVKKFLA